MDLQKGLKVYLMHNNRCVAMGIIEELDVSIVTHFALLEKEGQVFTSSKYMMELYAYMMIPFLISWRSPKVLSLVGHYAI